MEGGRGGGEGGGCRQNLLVWVKSHEEACTGSLSSMPTRHAGKRLPPFRSPPIRAGWCVYGSGCACWQPCFIPTLSFSAIHSVLFTTVLDVPPTVPCHSAVIPSRQRAHRRSACWAITFLVLPCPCTHHLLCTARMYAPPAAYTI